MKYLLRSLDGQPDQIIDIHNVSDKVWTGLMIGSHEIFIEGQQQPLIATSNYWLWRLQHNFRKATNDEREVLELRDLDNVFEEAKILLDDEGLAACLQLLLESLDKFDRWADTYEAIRENVLLQAKSNGIFLKPVRPLPALISTALETFARGVPLSREEYHQLSEYFGGQARYRAYQEIGWEDIKDLSGIFLGDIMRSKVHYRPAIVSAHYGNRLTLVSSQDVTNPGEWQVRRKS